MTRKILSRDNPVKVRAAAHPAAYTHSRRVLQSKPPLTAVPPSSGLPAASASGMTIRGSGSTSAGEGSPSIAAAPSALNLRSGSSMQTAVPASRTVLFRRKSVVLLMKSMKKA